MKRATELEFLQYFYGHADEAMGPASGDCYYIIQQNFKRETGKELPEGYDEES